MTALKGLVEYYKGKKIFDFLDSRTDYKSGVDFRLMNIVMEEQESKLLLLLLLVLDHFKNIF